MDVEIPGGKAVLREHVRARGRALQQSYALPLPKILQRLPRNAKPGEEARGLGPADGLALWDFQAAVVLAHLESWTLDAPLPKTMDDIGEMDEEVFQALVGPATELFKKDQRPDFDPTPDRESPTGPSSDSSQRERAVEEVSESTPTSDDGTETTSTDDSFQG